MENKEDEKFIEAFVEIKPINPELIKRLQWIDSHASVQVSPSYAKFQWSLFPNTTIDDLKYTYKYIGNSSRFGGNSYYLTILRNIDEMAHKLNVARVKDDIEKYKITAFFVEKNKKPQTILHWEEPENDDRWGGNDDDDKPTPKEPTPTMDKTPTPTIIAASVFPQKIL